MSPSHRTPAPRSAASAPNSRAAAADILARWLETQDFPDRLTDDIVRDRAFVMEVVYGVARRRRSLDWALRPFVARAPAPAIDACLLTGAYQLLCMDSVPAHAAVNESVNAARAAGGPRAAGFVNSVLRRLAERAPALRADLLKQPLGVRESFPDALLNRWVARYGTARAEALCRWHNTRPRTTLRVDLRRTTMDDLMARLQAAGIAAETHPFRPERCLVLPAGVAVPDVPGYAEGQWTAQDPATMAAVELLAVARGQRVLDACAAPGGKAMAIAEALDGTGELVALDAHADRLGPLRENVTRMAAPVEILTVDARDPALASRFGNKPFDRILADVPCSNTGVLRRRPDARWRFSTARLRSLNQVQTAILDNLAGLLAPGGSLVYSTCSLEAEENEMLTAAWLKRHPDFTQDGAEFLFPPDSQTDGAFAARLKKQK